MAKHTARNSNVSTLFRRCVLAGGYALLSFVTALSISWFVLALSNFGYGLWHDIGGIEEGIEKYGPLNRFKPGFADTTRAQRIDLFQQINYSVHHGGEGLAQIHYQTPSSGGVQLLLRAPEIEHLQDVANLIDFLRVVALGAILAWGIASVLLWRKRALPRLLDQCAGLAIWLLPAVVAVLIIGPETVFNFMHVQVFPPGHQWFFYYQESLMSTMMLAPVLFGWIAAAMLLSSLVLFFVFQGMIASRSRP
ncbi:DUF1461 domain-containing protein [Teredinibacter turnerae]|uniref:lipoprotein intramolecular transacylase Lit n=1 Tax=Teredinibacter turnerae TaxID=2426 RepID=UPI0030CA9F7D